MILTPKRAFIGDCHGCIDELRELHALLISEGVDEVWHLGDLVDRGPDSHGVIQFCIENNIRGIMGNHDQGIVNHWDRGKELGKHVTRNPDKRATLKQLDESDIEYLRALPYYHVFDDIKTVIVHGGMEPGKEFYQQSPSTMCRAQLINSSFPGSTRWFQVDMKGVTEDEHRSRGWERWYRLWDHEYNVIFGHSGFTNPLIYTNSLGGRCIGVDTSCCFGGSLTAVVLPGMAFYSVPAKQEWCPNRNNFIRDPGGDEIIKPEIKPNP